QVITVIPGYAPMGIPDQAIRGATIDLQLRQRFVSQELRLAGGSDSFDWLVGGYYFNQHQDQDRQRDVGINVTFPFALYIREDYQDERKGYAAFGQASFRPMEKLELTGGIRYSSEKVTASGQRVQRSSTGGVLPVTRNSSVDFDNVSLMGSVGYQVDPDIRVYATVAQGWKAGGINRFPTAATGDLPYKEEESVNYEVGLKTRLGRLGSFNLALYQIDIKNQQLTNIIPAIPTPISTIDNAASSRVRGFEGEVTLHPTSALELSGAFAYSHSRFNNYIRFNSVTDQKDFSGTRFENVPEVTANASALYRIPLGNGNRVEVFGEYSYVGSIIFQDLTRKSNASSQLGIPSYDRVNAKLSYVTENGWNVSMFVNNVLNTFDYNYISADPFLGGDLFVTPLAPRQFGVVLSKSF
ncbi:MAG: TonB-dependent receptor, partial [Croceibacterium sp.]